MDSQRLFVCVTLMAVMLQGCTTAVVPTHAHAVRHDPDDVEESLMHVYLPRSDAASLRAHPAEATNAYWQQLSKQYIQQQHKRQAQANTRTKAKNIILFLGDGMGLATVAAARNVLGGEEQQLFFEQFPYLGLSKTYAVDRMVPDSACTATAYLCGVKANYGTIGVNAAVQRDDCEAMRNTTNHVHSIAKWALDAGKAAGLVTTARVTHASPAGVYAHTADREWENDSELAQFCGPDAGLDDIAVQLIHGDVGARLKVMLGGGRKMFVDAVHDKKGVRQDGRNLIEEYKALSTQNAYVQTREQLLAANASAERLLGLFSNGHLDYHMEALEKAKNTEPTLAEMTRKAIEVLETHADGYFLFVEGAKIDMGHHYAWARQALDETVEFAKAVELARNMTSEQETLIVVTADHSHTFSVAGYQERNSDIFSLLPSPGKDKLPYLALSYANGPGFEQHYNAAKHKRVDPSTVQTGARDDRFPGTAPIAKETHGGEDVAVYASGPWSQLFAGVYEQNAIPHMMAYAACVGNGAKACDTK